MRKLQFLIITVLVFCFPILGLAQNINPNTFPINEGFITDQSNLLSQTEKSELETKLSDLQKTQGIELAIVTVDSLNDYPIEDYTLQLGRHWKVGQKDTNSGLIFLIAPNDRQARIEVGYGLEGQLTDAQSYWIIQEIIPYFQNKDYSTGIMEGTNKIIQTVEGTYFPQKPKTNPFESSITILFFTGFIITWLSSIFGRSKSWWAGGVAGAGISSLITFLTGLSILSLFAIIPIILTTLFGLILDYHISKAYKSNKKTPWWAGGGPNGGGFFGSGGSSSSGGFGSFSGGSFGGGGSSGRW